MDVPEPQLDRAATALSGAGAQFVVIGGFAVIAHRYVRATEDVDFLIPDDVENDARLVEAFGSLHAVRSSDGAEVAVSALTGSEHLRVRSDAGLLDFLRGGAPPLDWETVSSRAMDVEFAGVEIRVASLRSIVGFKRLSGRPRDRNDLEELEAIHGELPFDPIPGLD